MLQQSDVTHSEANDQQKNLGLLLPVPAHYVVMLCEMHSVASTPAAASIVTPVTVNLDAAAATTTAPATAPCVCIHRKRTLDTLRQRLSRRLKRARRHRHDIIDDASIDDDVSDDADNSAGELVTL